MALRAASWGIACDYVLIYDNQKVCVVEAKRPKLAVAKGAGQNQDRIVLLAARQRAPYSDAAFVNASSAPAMALNCSSRPSMP